MWTRDPGPQPLGQCECDPRLIQDTPGKGARLPSIPALLSTGFSSPWETLPFFSPILPAVFPASLPPSRPPSPPLFPTSLLFFPPLFIFVISLSDSLLFFPVFLSHPLPDLVLGPGPLSVTGNSVLLWLLALSSSACLLFLSPLSLRLAGSLDLTSSTLLSIFPPTPQCRGPGLLSDSGVNGQSSAEARTSTVPKPWWNGNVPCPVGQRLGSGGSLGTEDSVPSSTRSC